VLIVDQFEEVFTLCREQAEREAFASALLQRINEGDIVVLTMRTDFDENISALPELQLVYEKARIDLRPLTVKELRDAIEKPATDVGLKIDEDVAQDLVGSIRGVQGGLPLLQFTLRELWLQRDRNRITRQVYERVGNPLLALGRAADRFYKNLSLEEQTTVERTLLKLVRPADSGTEFTRNRVPIEDVYKDNDAKDRVDRVLVKLEEAGLVRHTGDGTQVEVVHEALIRNWGTLKIWLERERERLRGRFLLRDRAKAWDANGRPEDESLLRGAELVDAGGYSDLNEIEIAYLEASRQRAESEEQLREAARQREIALAKKTAREFRTLAFALAVAVAIAALASILAVIGWRQAESRELSALARVQLDNTAQPDPLLAAMLALKANDTVPTDESDTALRQSLFESDDRYRLLQDGPVRAASFLPAANGQFRLVTLDGGVHLWRSDVTGIVEDVFSNSISDLPDPLQTARSSPDGRFLILAGGIPTVTVLSLDNHAPVYLAGHEGGVINAEFSADGKRILTAGSDGKALLWAWDGANASLQHTLTQTLALLGAHLSENGQRVVTLDSGGTVTVWSSDTGSVVKSCSSTEAPSSVALSADGARFLAIIGSEASITDVATCNVLQHLKGHLGQINSAMYSLGGERIVTAGTDGTARIWNPNDGKPVAVLLGHDGSVNSAEFSPDGKYVVTTSDDETAHVQIVDLDELKRLIRNATKNLCSNRDPSLYNPLYERVCQPNTPP